MNRTPNKLEQIIDELAASTRSPHGEYSAMQTYHLLHKRMANIRKRIFIRRTVSSAAAVLLLSVMSWSLYTYAWAPSIKTVSTLAEVKNIELPDGTSVSLNRYSTISYPRRFAKKTRQVNMEGEVYFEVTKDSLRPFTVSTDRITVEVLGTHFNVEAYRHDPEVKTTLMEGSVAVSNRENTQRLTLKPNESAVYDKDRNVITMHPVEGGASGITWKDGSIVFTNLPLEEIARQLSNAFNTHIRVKSPSLAKYRMTARFSNNERLIDILLLLKSVGGFAVERRNSTIYIIEKHQKLEL